MDKINAFVYKDNNILFLVPLVNEKKIIHQEELYTKCDNGKPLNEESVALCWYNEISPNTYKTVPVIIVDLIYNDKKIKANKLKFDDLVTCAYQACIIYTTNKNINI